MALKAAMTSDVLAVASKHHRIAAIGGSEEHLALGSIPRCPDCGSTTTTGLSDV